MADFIQYAGVNMAAKRNSRMVRGAVISAVLLVAAYAAWYLASAIPITASESVSAALNGGNSQPVRLADATSFPWDSVLVFERVPAALELNALSSSHFLPTSPMFDQGILIFCNDGVAVAAVQVNSEGLYFQPGNAYSDSVRVTGGQFGSNALLGKTTCR